MAESLWLTPSRRDALMGAFRNDADWLKPIAALAAVGDHDRQEVEPRFVVRMALDAFLRGDAAAAERAAAYWCASVPAARASADLHKAHVAIIGAVLTDCANGLLSAESRSTFITVVRELADSFFDVSAGNPHAVGNNWWAVTHSGIFCIAAALQILGDSEPIRGRTPAEIEEWSWGRLRAFLGHFGPEGAYHEGIGYMGYTCANLLPAVLLRMARSKEDVMSEASGISRIAPLFFCAATEGLPLSDETLTRTGWGRMLSWNDAGLGLLEGSAPLLAICLAPVDERSALRARWDRLAGHLRPDSLVDEFTGALFFHAAFYSEAGGTDGTSAPLQVCDPLHGLWIARNRCVDENDAVAGAYARAFHCG